MSTAAILLHDDRLSIVGGGRGGELSILWDEVYAVSYSEIDAINYRVRYLTFDWTNGEFLEVSDLTSGWEELLTNLWRYLPTSERWYDTPAIAQYEDGCVTIFEREQVFETSRE